jgi:hypothetical protein
LAKPEHFSPKQLIRNGNNRYAVELFDAYLQLRPLSHIRDLLKNRKDISHPLDRG